MTRRPARRTSSSPQDPHVCRSPSYDIQAKIGFARCWLLRRVPAPRIRFTSPSPPARPGSHASRGGAFSRQLWWAAYPSPPYRYCRVASGRGRPHLPPATISETGTVDAPCKLRRNRARTAPASILPDLGSADIVGVIAAYVCLSAVAGCLAIPLPCFDITRQKASLLPAGCRKDRESGSGCVWQPGWTQIFSPHPTFSQFLLFVRSGRSDWALPTSPGKELSALPGREAQIELRTWAGLTSPGKLPPRASLRTETNRGRTPDPSFPLQTLSVDPMLACAHPQRPTPACAPPRCPPTRCGTVLRRLRAASRRRPAPPLH
jgi:hypothetical protein